MIIQRGGLKMAGGITLTLNDIDYIRSTDIYKQIKSLIEKEGFIEMAYSNGATNKKIKVFLPEMYYLLSETKIPYSTLEDKDSNFDGTLFIEPYVEGYLKGWKYFEKTYAVSADVLYSPGGKEYIGTLHHLVFHSKVTTSSKTGWDTFRSSWISPVNKINISVTGYYAGLLDSVLTLMKSHPQPFLGFKDCAKFHVDSTEAKPKRERPTYQLFALYYFYLQKAELIDSFENWDGGIQEAYKKISKDGGYKSWTKFRNEYRKIVYDSSRKKIAQKNLTKLLKLLKDSPKAIEEVKKEQDKTKT